MEELPVLLIITLLVVQICTLLAEAEVVEDMEEMVEMVVVPTPITKISHFFHDLVLEAVAVDMALMEVMLSMLHKAMAEPVEEVAEDTVEKEETADIQGKDMDPEELAELEAAEAEAGMVLPQFLNIIN